MMEAVSIRKAKPLWWVWNNRFIRSFTPYTIMGAYKNKFVGSIWYWA